jgi:hypothetical protein
MNISLETIAITPGQWGRLSGYTSRVMSVTEDASQFSAHQNNT